MTTAQNAILATIRTLAEQIAPLLGYTIVNDPERDWRVELMGPEEACLYFTSPWRPQNRIRISGVFPHWGDHLDLAYTPTEKPEITIALTSSVQHAERQIKSRLLPIYLRELKQACSARAKWTAHRTAQDRAVDTLADAGALRSSHRRGCLQLSLPDNPNNRWPHADFEVCEYDCSVQASLSDLTIEQALAVIRALRNLRDPPKFFANS